ncbi:MAG: hypothetical protein H7A23_23800 [Leptospiraceae bacterium]|nr:hypothetical protein [Leptospiraceae bacterium]MCP5497589.1 hypothetical protein [Leptospiraceae bacterium]
MEIQKLLQLKWDKLNQLKENYKRQSILLLNKDWESAFKLINTGEQIAYEIAQIDEKLVFLDEKTELKIKNDVINLLEEVILIHENVHQSLEAVLDEYRFELNQISVKRQLSTYLNRNLEEIEK